MTTETTPDSLYNERVEVKKQKLEKVLSSDRQYWMGHVANWTSVITLIAISVYNHEMMTPLMWVLIPLCAFYTWTFLEYVFHRWGYHENESFFAVGHLMHHDRPNDLLGMPWIINVVTLAALLGISHYLFGFNLAGSALFIGVFWLGHIWYTLIHHGIHHWNFKWKWYKRLSRHHKVHHKIPDKNLGVTTIFWDILFKTRV